MKRQLLDIKRVTNNKWINLFAIKAKNSKGAFINWMFASRKDNPIDDTSTDVVVIIPLVADKVLGGRKLVIIKEFRWAINDYEYGFPAGLIEYGLSAEKTIAKELKEETGLDLLNIIETSNPVYSSSGLTDESCIMAIVEAEGTPSVGYQEKGEDIEVLIMDIDDIKELLRNPSKKVGAKAWGVLYYYTQIGRIE